MTKEQFQTIATLYGWRYDQTHVNIIGTEYREVWLDENNRVAAEIYRGAKDTSNDRFVIYMIGN